MEGSGPLGRQVSGVSGRPLPRGRDGNGCGPFPRPTTPGPGRKCRPARRADPGSGGPPGPGFGNAAADRSRGARGPRTWHPGFYHSLTLWGGPAHMGLMWREGAVVVLRHTRGHFRRAGGSERGKASCNTGWHGWRCWAAARDFCWDRTRGVRPGRTADPGLARPRAVLGRDHDQGGREGREDFVGRADPGDRVVPGRWGSRR